MRDADTVYLVELSEGNPHQGYSTTNMTLLFGLQVMVVPDVMIVEMDYEGIQDTWEENMECLLEGEPGYQLREVTEAEADQLWARRFEFSDQEELDVAEAEQVGRDAYEQGLWITDNPYDEAADNDKHQAWCEGWEARYEEMRGRSYDPDEEHEQEAADDAASTATLLRWFYEEQHAG
jgi:hypothetical protein